MAKRKKRGGRRKRKGEREANGRLSRRSEEHAIRKLAAFQRRHLRVKVEDATQPLFGYPLGVLAVKGVIDMRLHDAGVSYRSAFMRWHSLMGFPPLAHRTGQFGRGIDPDDEVVRRAAERLKDANAVLNKCGVTVLAVVSDVVIEDVPPLTNAALADLRVGLTALAGHFRIPNYPSGDQNGKAIQEKGEGQKEKAVTQAEAGNGAAQRRQETSPGERTGAGGTGAGAAGNGGPGWGALRRTRAGRALRAAAGAAAG